MKIDKYKGYWKVKGENTFIKVICRNDYPRWRNIIRHSKGFSGKPLKTTCVETVDYLRLKCEKITEDTFKEYVNK